MTPPVQPVAVEIRGDDTDIHPAAIAREAAAAEDAYSKLRRFIGGIVCIVMSGVAFWQGVETGNALYLIGGWIGAAVSGNVIPYTVVRDIIVLRFKGGGG
jgi:hypothetical protein